MNDAPRIVNTFLGMYKKSSSIPRFVITQGISNFLSVVPRSALQSSLDPLLNALHVMVIIFLLPTFVLLCNNYSSEDFIVCILGVGSSGF